VKALTGENETLEAKLEYVAMMTDVDIDTPTDPEEGGTNV
jgi:hypothetical protein